MLNLMFYLNRRETSFQRLDTRIIHHLENSFLNNLSSRDQPIDLLPSTENPISTIALALAPDGSSIASTHGDHTVKVFDINSGHLKRSFTGHPRTPWTVKYNPVDSNIVVSGCLGFEVRVWDINRGICLNMIKLDSCIITLAYHMSGNFIMISSGPNLFTWDWKEGMAVAYGGYPHGQSPHPPRKIITHTRNIRAVIFHPEGKYVFVAAPDTPKKIEDVISSSNNNNTTTVTNTQQSNQQQQQGIQTNSNSNSNMTRQAGNQNSSGSNSNDKKGTATNRLYGFPFEDIFLPRNPPPPSSSSSLPVDRIQLHDLPTVIPEVHLYSDGGLDISKDGRYLITGASAYIPYESTSTCIYHNITLPPPAAVVAAAAAVAATTAADVTLHSKNNITSSSETKEVDMMDFPTFPSFAPSSSHHSTTTTSTRNMRTSSDIMLWPDVSSSSSTTAATSSSIFQRISSSTSSSSQTTDFPYFSMELADSRHHDDSNLSTMHVDSDPTLVPSTTSENTMNRPPYVDSSSSSSSSSTSHTTWLPDTHNLNKRHSKTITTSSSSCLPPSPPPSSLVYDASYIQCRPRFYDMRNDILASQIPIGWKAQEMLCLFKINIDDTQHQISLDLIQHRNISASLMKAVTSIKFSPTGQVAVLGYGVRKEGTVEDHPERFAACEVIKFIDDPGGSHGRQYTPNSIKSIALIKNPSDEVNVAQFHTIPSCGIIYGTKSGKVRMYQRNKP